MEVLLITPNRHTYHCLNTEIGQTGIHHDKKKDLKYPSMRDELIDYLRELSDLEYQKQNWLSENSKTEVPRSQFDYSVHFLFDDTSLATDPEGCIGYFLLNYKEAKAIELVVSSINHIFRKYGSELTDDQYINTIEWSKVLESSKAALVECGVV